jgi:molybdopterin-guanine dinucleotide biosynthesis protein B
MQTKIVSFIGRSNSGKTTFITKILPLFCDLGLKVGTVKNTHHKVDFDQPGKDSLLHRQAGSTQVLLLTDEQLALYSLRDKKLSLNEMVKKWFPDFDLVISEGFKNEDCFKVEISRKGNHKLPLYLNNYNIQAFISDYPPTITNIPLFNLNEVEPVFNWLCQELQLKCP